MGYDMDKHNRSIYPSEARTVTPSTVEISDRYVKGIQVIINVTDSAATPSVVPTIDGFDPLSETWYNLLTGSAITGASQTILRIHPELAEVANLIAKDFLPKKYRIVMTHGDADSITYSVSINSTA